MDPDACLKRLLDACRDHNRDTAEEAARDLLRWIESGGFLPSDPRHDPPKGIAELVADAMLKSGIGQDLVRRDPQYEQVLALLIRLSAKRAIRMYLAQRGPEPD